LVFVFAAVSVAGAQTPQTPPPNVAAEPDPDLRVNPAEPDFTLSMLPTTLRMPARKLAFRLTHRFTRPIASGDVGDFFADLFGFDSAATVGLELRYGMWSGAQAAVLRTNDRSIQLLSQFQLLGQSESRRLTIDALVAAEGLNNFSEQFSGSVGALVSRKFGEHGAVYFEPMFVSDTNLDDPPVQTANNTTMIGIGARFRLGTSKAYVVAEAAPRIAGYDAGVSHVSFGIERRAGGHMFQFNVSNTLAATLRQIARGGVNSGDWYVGFNLTRRFY
jgi:hypothetical protein